MLAVVESSLGNFLVSWCVLPICEAVGSSNQSSLASLIHVFSGMEFVLHLYVSSPKFRQSFTY